MGSILTIAGAITILVTGAASLWLILARVNKVISLVHDFLDDWNGEKPRHGDPGRKGVMERLTAIEKEVTFNGGKSIKDTVHALRAQHELMSAKLDEVHRLQTLYHPSTPVQINVNPTGEVEVNRPET